MLSSSSFKNQKSLAMAYPLLYYLLRRPVADEMNVSQGMKRYRAAECAAPMFALSSLLSRGRVAASVCDEVNLIRGPDKFRLGCYLRWNNFRICHPPHPRRTRYYLYNIIMYDATTLHVYGLRRRRDASTSGPHRL